MSQASDTADGLRDAPADPEAAARAWRALVALALCAVGLELCMLWLDRISLQKAIVWPAAERAIRALFAPVEAIFGAIYEDNTLTREKIKVYNLMTGFLPAFLLHLFASWLVFFRLPTNDRRVLKLIFCGAVLFRLTLVPFPPILETDLHRYVWDGAVSGSHVNPFKYAPVEISKLTQPGHLALYAPEEAAELTKLGKLLVDHSELAAHFPRINHPKIPTIYPPLAQHLFAVAFVIAPGSDVPVKSLVAMVDLLIVGMIVVLLGQLGLNRCHVVIYAWSPLILKEYANTGHYDPLATLTVLVALSLILKRTPVLPGVALALGTASKFYPLVVSLVLAPWLGVLGLAAYAITLALMYVPYMGIGFRMFDGLRAMASDWEFNSSLFTAAERIILTIFDRTYLARVLVTRKGDPSPPWASGDMPVDAFLFAKIACTLTGLGFVIYLFTRPTDDPAEPVVRTFAVTAALVLLSPVSDPWYFAWVMPFVALYPSGSWLYLSGSMIIYYMYFWAFPWGYLNGARQIEYLPFYALLANEHAEALGALLRWLGRAARWPFRRAAEEIRSLRGGGIARRSSS